MNCVQIISADSGYQVRLVLAHQSFNVGPPWDTRGEAQWFAQQLVISLYRLEKGQVLEVQEL